MIENVKVGGDWGIPLETELLGVGRCIHIVWDDEYVLGVPIFGDGNGAQGGGGASSIAQGMGVLGVQKNRD